MKRQTLAAVAAAMLSLGAYASVAPASDLGVRTLAADKSEAKTITGKSGCATCEGVTAKGHSILLTDKEGHRWVLLGSGSAYKAAHEVRKEGKTITATLAGTPIVKKDAEGKEYKEVKVSDIKVEA